MRKEQGSAATGPGDVQQLDSSLADEQHKQNGAGRHPDVWRIVLYERSKQACELLRDDPPAAHAVISDISTLIVTVNQHRNIDGDPLTHDPPTLPGRQIAEAVAEIARALQDHYRVLDDEDAGDDDEYKRVGNYAVTRHGLVKITTSKDGVEHQSPLTNFRAWIVADVAHDDGAEVGRTFRIDLCLDKRRATVSVPRNQFCGMHWPVEALGAEAVVYAGTSTADHARAAIQLLSSPERRTVYTHTGWRQIDGEWLYRHSGGAISAAGGVSKVYVCLPDALDLLKLQLVDDPRRAIEASLHFLELGPDLVTVPLYGSLIRAVLSGADFSIFLYGRTGVFKTELAALIQQHFGAGFDARHLPTSFVSTANANEVLAFAAKNAVLVVDELRPPASGAERDQTLRDASRLIRAQGNHAGRGRMRADGSLRPAKPPRGLVLATGEELPPGQSANARLLIVEARSGDIDPTALTECQARAEAGLYAQATAAFIRWLAPRLECARVEFRDVVRSLRSGSHHEHARTADIRDQLTAGYSLYLAFAREAEVIHTAAAEHLQRRIETALEQVAEVQAHYSATVEPTKTFLRLLSSAMAAGAAHVADRHGTAPFGREQACGWRSKTISAGQYERNEWQPLGDRVGWLDGGDLYLDTEGSYRAAQRMATDGGGIEVSTSTLRGRLRDRGLLCLWTRNGRR